MVLTLFLFAVCAALTSDRPGSTEAAEVFQIGTSVHGRAIEVSCFVPDDSADARVVLIVGAIHTGAEAITFDLAVELTADIARGRLVLPEGTIACVLPSLNPDGLALDVHFNANEVDLNRNWPSPDWDSKAWHPATGPVSGGASPLSEPETEALHDFIEIAQPSAIIVFHCCGALVEANRQPDAVFMARRYARAAGFEYLDRWNFYDISGEFIDSMDRLRIPAMDVELTSSDETGREDHRAGVSAVLEYLAQRPR